MYAALILSVFALAAADVSHLNPRELEHNHALEASTEPPPARPYVFSYTAGRFPGHADRQHTEVSDGSGVIRGSFSYVDPRHTVRTVDYVADKQGFHPVLSDSPPDHPKDSDAVALEKQRHYALYTKIAEDHATNPHPGVSSPRESAAVRAAADRHSELFRRIAEQHARIAAEREQLQQQEELQHQQDEFQHQQDEFQHQQIDAQLPRHHH